jgi:hypothetical protein
MRQATTIGPYLVDSSNSGPALAPKVMRWHRICQILGRAPSQSQSGSETLRPEPDRLALHLHNYINATFSKRGFIYPVLNTSLLNMASHLAVSCRVCVETLKWGAVTCLFFFCLLFCLFLGAVICDVPGSD